MLTFSYLGNLWKQIYHNIIHLFLINIIPCDQFSQYEFRAKIRSIHAIDNLQFRAAINICLNNFSLVCVRWNWNFSLNWIFGDRVFLSRDAISNFKEKSTNPFQHRYYDVRCLVVRFNLEVQSRRDCNTWDHRITLMFDKGVYSTVTDKLHFRIIDTQSKLVNIHGQVVTSILCLLMA